MNVTLEKITQLPDYMEPEDLKLFFTTLLEQTEMSDYEKALALHELSDRQWHTYKLVDNDIKYKVEAWINARWQNQFTKRHITSILAIIGMLGLQDAYDKMRALLIANSFSNKNVEKEIVGAIKEFGDDVTNPFRDRKDNSQ